MKEAFLMKQTMRWYGPNDPVSLRDIRQSGASGIVTALHHIPNGEVWEIEEILKRKEEIERAGMTWDVVESVPVHEHIKTKAGSYLRFIENYNHTLINLAKAGINTVCYNFMPILDWTRTDLSYKLENGAKALRFDIIALAAFDVYILKRSGALNTYSPDVLKNAEDYFNNSKASSLQELTHNIIKGLPGAEEGYSLEQFQQALDTYQEIGHVQLAENLDHFLSQVIPVAEKHGIRLAIHPDDPPFDIFGLPRVVSNSTDLRRIFSKNPSFSNGLTFCTGSFGVLASNDLPNMVKEFGDRIHFLHLRSTQRDELGNFFEANHLEGDVPMANVIQEILYWQKKRKESLPMRPDHGHQMLDDLDKTTNPGYSCIGRLKGLAELRGLEMGLAFHLNANDELPY